MDPKVHKAAKKEVTTKNDQASQIEETTAVTDEKDWLDTGRDLATYVSTPAVDDVGNL